MKDGAANVVCKLSKTVRVASTAVQTLYTCRSCQRSPSLSTSARHQNCLLRFSIICRWRWEHSNSSCRRIGRQAKLGSRSCLARCVRKLRQQLLRWTIRAVFACAHEMLRPFKIIRGLAYSWPPSLEPIQNCLSMAVCQDANFWELSPINKWRRASACQLALCTCLARHAACKHQEACHFSCRSMSGSRTGRRMPTQPELSETQHAWKVNASDNSVAIV